MVNTLAIGLCRKKIHTPTTEGMLENLTGGGLNDSRNSDERGGGGRGILNLTLHPGLASYIHPCFHRLNR